MTTTGAPLTKKDFKSNQEVRWCPGCGDYAILNAVQTAFANLGKNLHETVVVSGIGCSSRFPYYMETYGFHTIHGRALAVATGLKLANPNLDVWVITGDGDSLSIGGNHLIHTLRRNVGLKVLLFNNRIYGLTKGQYSPTSEKGKFTKSTPMGSVDQPFSPISLALGAGATWIGRSVDIFAKHLVEMVETMDAHQGTALLEIYQNCNIFNDGAYKHFTEKDVRDERTVELRRGEPLLFGKDKAQGLRFDSHLQPEIVTVGDGGVSADALPKWEPDAVSPAAAMALASASEIELPVPIGVFRDVQRPAFETDVLNQIAVAQEKKQQSIDELLAGNETWTVA
jgi:2-oxoglutarate ferredoxin oxidoreductase subunit beta